tara:strand:+ start:9561 stop:11348 length:1788 start_codon:yes stop_codon:yes gene_type:complete
MSKYLEIAYAKPSNRGIVIEKRFIKQYIDKAISERTSLYRSTYVYPKDIESVAEKTNSIKSYNGPKFIDWVVLDIDKGDDTDENTLNAAKSVCMLLEDLDLTGENYRPYFSGTGYHIHIPASVFMFRDSEDLPYTVKATIKKLFPYVDLSVLNRTGIYRVAHTMNLKSGLFKVPLFIRELMNYSVAQIKLLAGTARLDFPYESLEGAGQLSRYIETEIPDNRKYTEVIEPSKVATCIQKMYHRGPIQGSRNNTLLRMASHWRRSGIPSDGAKTMAFSWNNNALEDFKVIEKIESVYNRGYQYGCKDELMNKFCSTKCIYYKRKDYLLDIKNAETLQQELEERMTTDYTGKTIPLSRMLGTDVECDVYPGELVTIFGYTGSNKTTLAQCLALSYNFDRDRIENKSQLSTLYLSLELSGWYLHRRNLQIASGQNFIDSEYKDVYENNKHLVDHIKVQTVAPTIKQIQEKITELKPALVVVDYIDLIDTHGKDEYSQIRTISHSLRSIAVNSDLIIIQISQVSRQYSRMKVLDLYAGKGSGAIENASSKVIGIQGEQGSNKRVVELFKNTDGSLFNKELGNEITLEFNNNFRLKRKDF